MNEHHMNGQVQINMSIDEAEEISSGLADLLCWHRGFAAARQGTELDHDDPMGVNSLRDLRIRLTSAIRTALELKDLEK